jgi:hypothetical protein
MIKTLKTLVLKTVQANSVKLSAPADRIGLGLGVAQYPAEPLSPGQVHLSNPEPESDSGSRQERPAMLMREHMRMVGATAGTSGRSAGCLSFPGSSAHRRPPSFSGFLASVAGWRNATKRTAASGRIAGSHGSNSGLNTMTPSGGSSVTGFPVVLGLRNQVGRDCQSPAWGDDRRTTKWEACHATAAGK